MRVARWFAFAALMMAGMGAQAQAADGPAKVTFTYERPGLDVPKYSLMVDESGHGHYTAAEVALHGAAEEPRTVEREVLLSPKGREMVFRMARAHHLFHMQCASQLKNLAKTGAKTLSYSGPEGTGECAFDYSDDKDVMALSKFFMSVAMTLDEGRLLDFERRFQRLDLDAEMIRLTELAQNGDAVELENIAPTLRAITADFGIIERARRRAEDLLAQANGGVRR